MSPWFPFVLCFAAAAVLAIIAAALRGMGYDVGGEWGEDE
jgi:hypothetical protein